MTVFVLCMTGFVLNTILVVLIMTGHLLNMTGIVVNIIGSDNYDYDDDSNGMSDMIVWIASC